MSSIVPVGKDLSKLAVANTVRINTLDDLQRLGELLAKSGFFEDCKQAAQAVVKILAGAELGFPAFAAMTGIYIIKGKPAMGANLMAAAVKRSNRYDYRVTEMSDKVCKIAFFERGKEIGVSEFTAADAARAGTQNMGKFPRNMLFARAMSNGCRWMCPDIFLGASVYTPEELGATVNEDGEVIELPIPTHQSDSPPDTRQRQSVASPTQEREVWKQWKNVSDAISWAQEQLPNISVEQLQQEFDALKAVDGKKARAWVDRVQELILEQF